jgi:hypothetical protein
VCGTFEKLDGAPGQSMHNSLPSKSEMVEGQQTIFFQIANGWNLGPHEQLPVRGEEAGRG